MERKGIRVALLAVVLLLTSTACAGWGGSVGGGGANSINVLMVNNPQMVDLQRLTAEHFTRATGITVNFTVLPENDVRDKISQEFSSQAGQFDVDLVREHGESGAPQAGFTECLNNMVQGNAAMWYDATSAAGSLEASDSPGRGKIGYAPAPVVETDSAGWLYAWSWGIQAASEKQDASWKFISWASSKEYEQLVGQEVGWSKVPAGKRASTYENPQYVAEASAFAEQTRNAIATADPRNPGVQPRPALGIQFVGIPEFPDLGTQVSQEVSSAIAGLITVDEALDRGQQLADDVAERYRSRAEGE